MNIIRTKKSFKAVAILFLTQSYTLTAMQMPWYQSCFNSGTGTFYRDNCKIINSIQNVRGAGLLAYHRLTHKKANLDKALCLIKDQLAEFKTFLLAAEQDALIAIKEKYQMSDELWQQYITETQLMKDIYRSEMLQAHLSCRHDPTIPADIIEMLITLLEQNGINPQSIHIKMISDKATIDTHKNNIALAKTCIETTTSNDSMNNFSIAHRFIPCAIEIFPRMLNLSTTNKISFCAHEIQHLLQHHGLTDCILTEYIKHHCGITQEEFKKSPEYHRLSQIHEAQAEILSAINNPHIAKCLKTMRKTHYYPEHLYEEHFFHLASIDMLWNVHGWLEFFHQDGVGKKRNEWFDTLALYINSLKQLVC